MQQLRENVTTTRECVARLVPVGTEILIPCDVQVTITQALGGSFTVLINGNLARIDESDADALGKPASSSIDVSAYTGTALTDQDIYQVMRSVYDPEIPVNIVDLGLVYHVDCHRTRTGYRVHVQMTLTAAGCGMGQVITEEVRQKVLRLPRVEEARVDLVFDPPWDMAMVSEEAQLELGLI